MKNYIHKLEGNILVSYIYNFITFFKVTNAVWVIYLAQKGMSLVQIGLLESIYHVASFTFEIPTGALADIFGRKTSLILGRISSIVSALLMIKADNFWDFAAAFVFSGLSGTLNSGAAESLLYDSVKQLQREPEYKKLSGKINFIVEISMVISVILGGWLSDISFLYAYIAAVIVDIAAIAAASGFGEPRIKSAEEHISFIKQIVQSAVVLKGKAGVFYMMLFFSVLSTVGANVYYYGQKYFSGYGYSNKYISVIFTLVGLASALMSKYSYKVEKRVKRAGIFFIAPAIYVLCLVGISCGSGMAIVGFFIVCCSMEGLTYPIASDYINSAIPSEYRATILSMYSTFYSVWMIMIFPMVGFLGQNTGLKSAFLYIAAFIVPLVAFALLKLKKHGQY